MIDLLTEKYRPQSLNDYIGNTQVKSKIAEYIKEGTLQNLLLFGPAGTGKNLAGQTNSKTIKFYLSLYQLFRRKGD